MEYDDELDVAKQAAREAGRVMEEYRETGVSSEYKTSSTDIVTEADIACQEAIVDLIHDRFPEDGFLAEEATELPNSQVRGAETTERGQALPPAQQQARQWVIDPIDGTTNYAHDFPYYCTSIALKDDGEPVVGVVYNPRADELFAAVTGEGAWLNGEPIETSDVTALQDGLINARVTDWVNQPETIKDRETAFLHELLAEPASFRRPGAAALDACQVAAGRMDGQALATINEWDIAAGRLIIEEAGGSVRVREAIIDGYLEFVASNGPLHDRLTAMFDKHVRNG